MIIAAAFWWTGLAVIGASWLATRETRDHRTGRA
jgi:hypothetical protein